MKKQLANLAFAAFALTANATVRVNMYASPVTIAGTHGSTNSHYIDAENDGIEDLRIYVEDYNGDFRIYVETINNQGLQAEYINTEQGIAYQCGASFGAGVGWYGYVKLADADEDFQYDGRGARYLAIRKEIATDYYVYGWLKLQCASDASEFTVYGFAYNDAPEYFPNISAGEGECMGATGLDELDLSANAVTIQGRELTINFSHSLTVRMFDTAGKKLLEYQFEGGSDKIYLPQPTGVYLMEVSDGIKTKTMKMRL